jgi:origin recognition complex subunit 3
MQRILREANQSTLDEVTSFVQSSRDTAPANRIPSAFIVTGPNIASQDLLFEQLSETLQAHTKANAVRLRSGDASNLKAVLKKIIHDVTATESDDQDDLEGAVSRQVISIPGVPHLNH